MIRLSIGTADATTVAVITVGLSLLANGPFTLIWASACVAFPATFTIFCLLLPSARVKLKVTWVPLIL
ncbi:MAG: hypothetical protein MOB07_22270 [Acidobacteria bacterium]|nr:hypothetical protein [Acidobacteriota bacterium]